MELSSLNRLGVLHHAYLISGSATQGSAEILRMLEERGISTKGNQDVLVLSFSELSVDDARHITSFASLNAVGEKKYIVVSFSRATNEGQNALLKVLEEAPGNSVFFLCIDAAGHVLPTLRSRCVSLSVAHSVSKEENEDAMEFLEESYEKRLARVEKMASYISKNQDRAPAREFVAALARESRERGFSGRALRDLLDADRYMRLSGSSAKSILGHLAVSLPHVK